MRKKRTSRPSWTQRGRIVYDRKVHEFSEKDLVRVFRAVVDREPNEDFVPWLVDLIILLLQVAIETLFRLYRESLPKVIAEFLIKILSGLIALVEKLGVGAFTLVQAALQKAFGLLVIEEATTKEGFETGGEDGEQADGPVRE